MLSNKTQLCVDILITMASAPPGSLVTTQALSNRLSVSTSHLESLMRVLREAGLVRSVRGPGGGYYLGKPADRISVWEVVCQVDPSAVLLSCNVGSSRLISSLEAAYHGAFKDYLSSRWIGEFAVPAETWPSAFEPVRTGFRLGPMPASLRPQAPNSVFELSAFLQAAPA